MDRTEFGSALFPLASGVLIVFAHPPFSIPLLAFVGLVPLFLWLDQPLSARQVYLGGWAFAVPYIVGCLYWFYGLGRFTAMGILGATGIMGLFLATTFIVPIVVNVLNHTLRLPLPLVAPLVWIVSEHTRSYGDLSFPAVTLGYSLSDWPSLIQHADLVGVYGISCWLVLINALIAAMIRERRHARRLTWHAVVLAVAILAPAVYNPLRWRHVEREMSRAETLSVAVIQPSIEQAMKWDRAAVDEIFHRINGIIATAERSSPDLVVGPEACLPMVLAESATRLPDEIAPGSRPLLLGAVTGIGEGEVRNIRNGTLTVYDKHYNSAWLAEADRSVLGRHDKQYLVPVTEQIPYKEVFGFLLPFMRKQFGRFVPADRLGLLELPVGDRRVPFGVLICYESLFPGLVRRMRAMGAEFLVNISNDAWFGRTSFAFMHAGFCAVRAIEARCSIVRSANTGVSAVYDPLGRAGPKTRLFQQTQFTATIPLVRFETCYARTGDLLLYLSYAAVAIVLALAWVHHRRALASAEGA